MAVKQPLEDLDAMLEKVRVAAAGLSNTVAHLTPCCSEATRVVLARAEHLGDENRRMETFGASFARRSARARYWLRFMWVWTWKVKYDLLRKAFLETVGLGERHE